MTSIPTPTSIRIPRFAKYCTFSSPSKSTSRIFEQSLTKTFDWAEFFGHLNSFNLILLTNHTALRSEFVLSCEMYITNVVHELMIIRIWVQTNERIHSDFYVDFWSHLYLTSMLFQSSFNIITSNISTTTTILTVRLFMSIFLREEVGNWGWETSRPIFCQDKVLLFLLPPWKPINSAFLVFLITFCVSSSCDILVDVSRTVFLFKFLVSEDILRNEKQNLLLHFLTDYPSCTYKKMHTTSSHFNTCPMSNKV